MPSKMARKGKKSFKTKTKMGKKSSKSKNSKTPSEINSP
jgi:hypothetical protein